MGLEGTLMAYPHRQEAPTPDQSRRFDAFMAALAPAMPVAVEMEPEWDGSGWTLWVKNYQDTTAFRALVDVSYDLAETNGIDVTVQPIIAKDPDD
jgi:hypothetical protein